MHLLIVEDDKLQFDFIRNALQSSQTFSNAKITRIVTESEFQARFEEIANEKPDVIVMDIMLRWSDPEKDMMFPPENIGDEGFFRAGVRCERLLAEDVRTGDIPVVLYSVLENEDFKDQILPRPQLSYLEKNFDEKEIEWTLRRVTLRG
jgi:CheY-like chemotaxis protein